MLESYKTVAYRASKPRRNNCSNDDDDDDDNDDDDRLRSDATRGVARAALVRLERERDERRGRRWRWSNAPFRGGRGGEEARDARGGDER